jgi:hypothetical protein
MILTRWFGRAYGEVERADPANDPDKTAHGESHIRRIITRKQVMAGSGLRQTTPDTRMWKRLCK